MPAAPVTPLRTKAETALLGAVTERVPRLAGGVDARKLRDEARHRFEASGLPTRRIEEWKYTDVRVLLKEAPNEPSVADIKDQAAAAVRTHGLDGVTTLVFVDGRLVAMPTLPKGVVIESLAHRLEVEADLLSLALPPIVDPGASSLVSLNAALASDGAVIRVAAETVLDAPIHLIFVSTGTVATRNHIEIGHNAEATVYETHVTAPGSRRQAFTHGTVTLGDGARLAHIIETVTGAWEFVFASLVPTLGADSVYSPFQTTIGQGTVRHQLSLTFAGERATFDFGAVTLLSGRGHADTTLVVDHAVPHCVSRELYKTVLNDHGRAVFQGKVIVRPDAQKTDGKQMAQAMMLSPTAEFDAKPELEIYADDVVCGHGATCAEIDADHMFYLRARGIPEIEARAMLIEGFLVETLDKIGHEAIRERLASRAVAWLRNG